MTEAPRNIRGSNFNNYATAMKLHSAKNMYSGSGLKKYVNGILRLVGRGEVGRHSSVE